MRTSELAKKHPGIQELAKKPYGSGRIKNYGPGDSTIDLHWNPAMAKHGLFALRFEGKDIVLDAEELRWYTRVI